MRAKAFTTTRMREEIQRFASYLREEKMRAVRTVAAYTDVVREFERFLRQGQAARRERALEAVEAGEIVRFLRQVANDRGTPSPATWNNRLAALRAFYVYLFRQELIVSDPTRNIERQKTNPREPIPLSPEEYFDVLDALQAATPCYRARDAAIVAVLFHTGMRVAELVSLDLDQVDLRNHLFLDVRVKGEKRISKKMNDCVAEAVERHLADRPGLKPKPAEKALFISDRGTRLSIRSVEELVHRYGERGGISRPVTPHILRHSSASVLSELGVPVPAIQRHLGHASSRTTERYIHLRASSDWVVNELGEHMKELEAVRARKEAGRKRVRRRVAAYSASKRN